MLETVCNELSQIKVSDVFCINRNPKVSPTKPTHCLVKRGGGGHPPDQTMCWLVRWCPWKTRPSCPKGNARLVVVGPKVRQWRENSRDFHFGLTPSPSPACCVEKRSINSHSYRHYLPVNRFTGNAILSVIIRDDLWHKQTYDRIKLNRNNRYYTSRIGNIDCIDVAEERESGGVFL